MLSPKFILSLISIALLCSWPMSLFAQKKERDQNPVPMPAPATPYSDVRRDSLLNGMQVVMLERAGERARCDLIIRAGAMFDLVGKVGLAALTQEALLAANPRLVEELESLQTKIEWGVTSDVTWFRLDAPPASFATAMEIVGRILVVENVRQENFKRAQQARLEQLKARAARPAPAERSNDAFLATIYGDHPYGHNIDGNEKTVAAITYGDVYDFYKRLYLANNSVVVLRGDLKHERALHVFKTYLGGWVKGSVVPPAFRQPQRTTEVRVVKVEMTEAPAVELRSGVIGVKQTDPDFIATQVLARVLEAQLKRTGAGQPTSIAVQAAPRILPGPFFISASVPAERAVEFSRQATDGFAALASAAVTAEELAAVKTALISEYAARPIEEQLREIEIYQLPRNYPLTFEAKVNAITAAELQRVARRLLEANALTVVVLGRVNENRTSQN
jgi:zinc protease